MSRAPAVPQTRLGAVVQRQRGTRSLQAVEREIGIPNTTLSRIERGGRPSYDTALTLARWLGWTVEQVMEAAAAPVEPAE